MKSLLPSSSFGRPVAVVALLIGLYATSTTAAAAATEPVAPTTQPAAPTTLPSAPSAELKALADELEHDDWRRRDVAEARLARLGEDPRSGVEAMLRQLVANTDSPEAGLRAQAVLEHIAAMRRLGPTRITARFEKATPQDVFAELSRQGDIPILPLRENLWRQRDWPAITLDLRDEPFWGALRRACSATGLRPIPTGGDGNEPVSIRLLADVIGDMARPVSFTGSFMVLASTIQRRPDFAAPAGAPADLLEVRLTFFADPKWRIVAHPRDCQIDLAEDQNGHPLQRSKPMIMQAYKPESPVWIMRTNVPALAAETTKLKRMRGSFSVDLLEQSDPIEIDNVLNAANVMRKAGRQAVQLQEIRREGELYRVKLILSRNGLSQQDWRQQRESEGINLYDAKGRPLSRAGFDAQDQGEQVIYDLQFIANPASPTGPGAPAKLTVRIPLEPRPVKVPFEFEDLAIE